MHSTPKLKKFNNSFKALIYRVLTRFIFYFFNMMMVVDASKATKDLSEVITDLDAIGEGIGVVIKCQREEIFDKMHRI